MTDKTKLTLGILTFRGIPYLASFALITTVFSYFNPVFVPWFFASSLTLFDVIGYDFVNRRKTFEQIKSGSWTPSPPTLANQGYRIIDFIVSFLCIAPTLAFIDHKFGTLDASFSFTIFLAIYITGNKETLYYDVLGVRLAREWGWAKFTLTGTINKILGRGAPTDVQMRVQSFIGIALAILITFIWQYRLWRLIW